MRSDQKKIFLILMVDDSMDARKSTIVLLKKLLSRKVEFIEAENVDDGIAVLKNNKIDAVICDYQMPEKNGLALLEFIRNHLPELPFVLYTGSKEFDEPVEAMLRPGLDSIVKKPLYFEIASLLKNPLEKFETEKVLKK